MASLLTGRTSAIERAFQIADSGTVSTVPELRSFMLHEGYQAYAEIVGKALVKQLSLRIKKAKAQ